jgi:glycosyltransferase involved in cell wall biosynthesis
LSEDLPADSTVSVQPLRLSIAAPVYHEEKVLPEFLRRTTQVLDAWPGGPHPLILVDDGSSDRSLEKSLSNVLGTR